MFKGVKYCIEHGYFPTSYENTLLKLFEKHGEIEWYHAMKKKRRIIKKQRTGHKVFLHLPEKTVCVDCLVQSADFKLASIPDWNNADLVKCPNIRPYLRARSKIYKAMERAYLNPEYAWCIRRLKRDFQKLQQETIVQ